MNLHQGRKSKIAPGQTSLKVTTEICIFITILVFYILILAIFPVSDIISYLWHIISPSDPHLSSPRLRCMKLFTIIHLLLPLTFCDLSFDTKLDVEIIFESILPSLVSMIKPVKFRTIGPRSICHFHTKYTCALHRSLYCSIDHVKKILLTWKNEQEILDHSHCAEFSTQFF